MCVCAHAEQDCKINSYEQHKEIKESKEPCLTCTSRRPVAGRGREDLSSEVLKGHVLLVVLNDGLQVQRSLLITDRTLREITFTEQQLITGLKIDVCIFKTTINEVLANDVKYHWRTI